MVDYVHMMLSIPPKVRGVARGGVRQGKSAIRSGMGVRGAQAHFVGQSFGPRGYFVSTVGRDEAVIREYIRNRIHEDVWMK